MTAEPSTSTAPVLALSFFESERDNRPAPIAVAWADLAAQLASPKPTACTVADCVGPACPHKRGEGAAAWSPAVYPVGVARGKRNVAAVSLLSLDIDHVTDDALRDLASRFEALRYIAHATHSDRAGDRCLRMVVALSRPVLADEWPRFWVTASRLLGVPVDPSTCDASRLYYLPTRPTGADYLFATNEGAPLDVEAILAQAPHLAQEPVAAPLAREAAPVEATDRSLAIASLAAAWPKSGRHRAGLALCGALAQGGWPEDEIASFVTEMSALANRDDGEPHKWRALARDSVSKVSRGESVTGWGSIGAEGVPDAVIGIVRGRLGMRDTAADALRAALKAPLPDEASDSATDGGESVAESLEDIAVKDRPPVRIYPTRIGALDGLLGGGIKTRQLAVIAAPPADGKSALVVDLALALEVDLPILYVSTELESDELLARAAGNVLGIAWTDIVNGNVDRTRVLEAVRGRRIRVIGCDKLPSDLGDALVLIAREAMLMRDRFGVAPWVVVDYLQDLARGASPDGERFRVGQIGGRLRVLAQGVDCPVWAVSSVGREFYSAATQEKLRKSDDARVYLRAAKESGDVDYAAATIIFLDVGVADAGKPRPARIAVAKCRHGAVGFAGAMFDGRTGRWREDAAAISMLSGVAIEQKAVVRQASADEEAILAFVRSGVRVSQRELRDLVPGLSKHRADEAIKSALASGRLVRLKEAHIDATQRMREREIVVEPGTEPREPFSASAGTPDPALARFTGIPR